MSADSSWDIADYEKFAKAMTASGVMANQNKVGDLAIAESIKWRPAMPHGDQRADGDMRSAFQDGFIRGYNISNSSRLQNEIDKLR